MKLSALIQQAIQFHKTGKLQEATDAYNKILHAEPRNITALHMLGVIAFQNRDYSTSEKLIRQALMLDPNQAIIHHNIAANYRVLGHFDEAREHYRTAIRLKPDYAEAYFNLSAITKFKEDRKFILAVEKIFQNAGLSDMDGCFLHYAAGKYYDDTGFYDKAFRHFEEGARMKNATFDCRTYNALVDRIIQSVDREFLRRHQTEGLEDEIPVFIVGMPRSGTTLVEQILSAHPEMFAAGELPDIPAISRALSKHEAAGSPYPECLHKLSPKVFRGFGNAYIKRVRSMHSTANRIVDKNPINHQHVGLILTMFPRAHVIHCFRDPLDTCLSCFFQNFRSGQEFSYKLENIGCYYRGYRRLMTHWKSIAPDNIFDLSYEDIVADLKGQASGLLQFLGLDWNDRCLVYHRSERPVETASDLQVRQPIYKTSLKRWRNYDSHLGPLRSSLKGFI